MTAKKAQDVVNLLTQSTPFTHDVSFVVTCDRDNITQVRPFFHKLYSCTTSMKLWQTTWEL